MGKHAIIVIKNKNNEYLQYFDERWNSYLFLNCKLKENFEEEIIKHISEKLKIDTIKCDYIGDKVHKKFSESDQIEKEYQHYFFKVNIEPTIEIMENKYFEIDNTKYCWYSYDELKLDKRIQKVNSDIVEFIKEFNL